MKPRILLSALGTVRSTQNYIDAITNCGGVAVEYVLGMDTNGFDGLLLCGGKDVNPIHYGEEVNGSVNINDERDTWEFDLIKQFVGEKKPIMGICRGSQILNIAFGGSLYQHIDNAQLHTKTPDGRDSIHVVAAKNGSLFGRLFGDTFVVNSSHHQAIKVLGDGFEITMTADDGKTIEGIEHSTLPIFATQWHPERMCFDNLRDDAVDSKCLFEHFINMCINQ